MPLPSDEETADVIKRPDRNEAWETPAPGVKTVAPVVGADPASVTVVVTVWLPPEVYLWEPLTV
jgi:hypothetical protein